MLNHLATRWGSTKPTHNCELLNDTVFVLQHFFSSDFRFERYDIEMLRAARLVFETGIHYYGLGHELNDDEMEMIFVRRWSKEEARDFIMEHTTLTSQRASVEVMRCLFRAGEVVHSLRNQG